MLPSLGAVEKIRFLRVSTQRGTGEISTAHGGRRPDPHAGRTSDFLRHVGFLHGAAAQADHLVGLVALGVGQGPTLPSTRISACSRTAQVLMTMTSASASTWVKA